jgi:nicotinamidase-related amidase
LKLGFKVYIITDAIKAVNLKPQDGDNALAQMKAYGAIPILSKDITIWKILF